MKNISDVWEFVEAYYPNYSSSDEIAENNDLSVIIDDEIEPDSCAEKLYNSIHIEALRNYNGGSLEIINQNIKDIAQNRLNESNAYIFEKAIEGYIEQQNELRFNTILETAKAEILEDIKTKLVPRTVADFSELHDYVDANYYGGFCEENYEASKDYEFENSVQSALNEWLKNGRP